MTCQLNPRDSEFIYFKIKMQNVYKIKKMTLPVIYRGVLSAKN